MAFAPAAFFMAAASSAYASNRAADATEDAADSAAAVQMEQYNQSRSDLAPYRETGTEALAVLGDLYGLSTPQLDKQKTFNAEDYQRAYMDYNIAQEHPNFSSRGLLFRDPWRHYNEIGRQYADAAGRYGVNLEEAAFGPEPVLEQALAEPETQPDLESFFRSPGYQFNLDETLSANEGRAAARGRLNSSATDRSNMRYASGLASNEFLNYTNRLNALAGIGQTTNQNLALLGANMAGNVGNQIMNAGNARASGYLGMGNTVNNMMGSYANYNAMNNLAEALYGRQA
ncbi:MAG: hypothetical protein AB2697_21830 [Candidatus Thiodiazotropha endolucinida]